MSMDHHDRWGDPEKVDSKRIVLEDPEERVSRLYDLMSPCRLCPRRCGALRLSGEKGFCGMGAQAVVSSYGPHFGEEPPLIGINGSGTIFMTGCNLGCRFCQNYDISHLWNGEAVTTEDLSGMMLDLQSSGCHNVNFVTPTHQVPQILKSIIVAKERGLSIPVVYNSGGYESTDVLRLLDGIVDIYMPDAKYMDGETAKKLSGVADYPEVMMEALKEMHRQVGNLELSDEGIATRGLLVRHLVLPGGLAGTDEFARFIAGEISPDTYVNIMGQYRPCYRAHEIPPMDRPVYFDEVFEARRIAGSAGLHRGFRRTEE